MTEKKGFILVGQATFQAYDIEHAMLRIGTHFLNMANEMADPDFNPPKGADFIGSLEIRPEE